MKRLHLLTIALVVVALGGFSAYAAADTGPVTITLNSTNSTFNESGSAILTAKDSGRTSVSITVSNEPAGETQYVFFQYGTCPYNLFFDVIYPLNDLTNNKSNSIFDVPLLILLQKGPMDGGGADKGDETPPPTAGPTAMRPHHNSGPPTSFAVAIWRYTTHGKTLVSCGDRALTGHPNFLHFQ